MGADAKTMLANRTYPQNSNGTIMELPSANTSLLSGLWTSITSDDNKKIFNRFTDEVGKSIGKHQVGTHVCRR